MNGRTRGAALLLAILGSASGWGQSVARVLIDEGWQNYQQRQWPEAQELLEQAVQEAAAARQEPDLSESRAKLAWVKFETHQTAAAIRLARDALKSGLATLDAARAELILARTSTSAEASLQHLERGRRILESAGDKEALAGAELSLAECHFELGDYQRAYDTSRRAAGSIDRQADPASRARLAVVTARAALALDRPDSALRPLAEIESLLDRDELRKLPASVRAECLSVLAESKRGEGDLEGAFSLLTRARAEIARLRPENNAVFAPIVLQQAQIRITQGRLDDALRYAKWLTGLGRHVDVRLLAEALAARGKIHFASGRYAAAQRDFQAALDRHAAASGTTHPFTLRVRLGLAKTYLVTGYEEHAKGEVRAILALDPSPRETGEAWRLLAQERLMSGHFVASLAIAERAKELLEQSGAAKTDEMLEVQWLLAAANLSAGRLEDAATERDRLVELRRQMPSATDLWTARTLQLDGLYELVRRDDEVALVQFERALEIWQRTHGAGSAPAPRPEFWQADRGFVFLGMAVAHAEGGVDVAESHWRSAHAAMARGLRNETIALRVASLGDFCVQHHRDFDALWLYGKARGLLEQALGPRHRWTREIERKLDLLAARNSKDVRPENDGNQRATDRTFLFGQTSDRVGPADGRPVAAGPVLPRRQHVCCP